MTTRSYTDVILTALILLTVLTIGSGLKGYVPELLKNVNVEKIEIRL